MTNMQIIESNLETINKCINCQFAKMDKQFMDDFRHDLIIILSEYDNAKMNDALENNHFNALVTSIIRKNIYSSTSEYYRKYLKFQNKTDEITDIIEKEDAD